MTVKSRENNFQTTVLTYLRQLPGIRVIKHWSGPYSEPGISDILICWYGLFIAIELKAPGTIPGGLCEFKDFKPTDLRERNQVLFCQSIINAGGIAFFCSELAALKIKMLEVQDKIIEHKYL